MTYGPAATEITSILQAIKESNETSGNVSPVSPEENSKINLSSMQIEENEVEEDEGTQ